MSTFEHKPGKGTVFKNTDPDRPHSYGGSIKLPDGTDCWVNLYIATDRDSGERKTDRDGNPYYNVGLKVKPDQGEQPRARLDDVPGGTTPSNDDLDSEIPF